MRMWITAPVTVALLAAFAGGAVAGSPDNPTANEQIRVAAGMQSDEQRSSGAAGKQGAGMQSGDSALTNDEVREAQSALKKMGLYDGEVDGLYGPRTISAVSEFQAQKNLERTGALDDQTQQELQMAAASGGKQQGQPMGTGQPGETGEAPSAEPQQEGGSEQQGQPPR